MDDRCDNEHVYVTEQMSINKGMATFGKLEVESNVAELTQLDYRSVVKLDNAPQLTHLQRRNVLY